MGNRPKQRDPKQQPRGCTVPSTSLKTKINPIQYSKIRPTKKGEVAQEGIFSLSLSHNAPSLRFRAVSASVEAYAREGLRTD